MNTLITYGGVVTCINKRFSFPLLNILRPLETKRRIY